MKNRKQQILTTAAQLFKDRGYSAVSMRDLAAAMDMKAASLYNHISGKQEILSTLILQVAREFTKGMERIQAVDDVAYAKASQLIILHIDVAVAYTDALAVLNNDWMHLEGSAYVEYIQSRKNYEKHFKDIIAAGITSGEWQAYEVDTVLFSLLSTLRSLYLWLPKRNITDIEQLKIQLPSILLNGLAIRT